MLFPSNFGTLVLLVREYLLVLHGVQEHESWWSQFWSRSYIHISVGGDGAATAHRVSQQYALQRYLEACSSRGALPIKFNGGLFTADAAPGPPSRDADYRRWGGGFWWQNTRLPYWGMLQVGICSTTRGIMGAIPKQLHGKSGFQLGQGVNRAPQNRGVGKRLN